MVSVQPPSLFYGFSAGSHGTNSNAGVPVTNLFKAGTAAAAKPRSAFVFRAGTTTTTAGPVPIAVDQEHEPDPVPVIPQPQPQPQSVFGARVRPVPMFKAGVGEAQPPPPVFQAAPAPAVAPAAPAPAPPPPVFKAGTTSIPIFKAGVGESQPPPPQFKATASAAAAPAPSAASAPSVPVPSEAAPKFVFRAGTAPKSASPKNPPPSPVSASPKPPSPVARAASARSASARSASAPTDGLGSGQMASPPPAPAAAAPHFVKPRLFQVDCTSGAAPAFASPVPRRRAAVVPPAPPPPRVTPTDVKQAAELAHQLQYTQLVKFCQERVSVTLCGKAPVDGSIAEISRAEYELAFLLAFGLWQVLDLAAATQVLDACMSRAPAMSYQSVSMRSLAAAIVGSNKHKTEGNNLFSRGEYAQCVPVYSAGLQACHNSTSSLLCNHALASILLSNRAAAKMKLGEYRAAEEDCSAALRLKPTNGKARLRRARCRVELGMYPQAREDFASVLGMADAELAANGIDRKSLMAEVEALEADIRRQQEQQQRQQRQRQYQQHQQQQQQQQQQQYQQERKPSGQFANPADFYAVLGVPRTATAAQVKKAYHQLALKYHPDKAAAQGLSVEECTDRFKIIGEAYMTLSDAASRHDYDRKH